jgi:cell division protein FtsW (lipid II flippase)
MGFVYQIFGGLLILAGLSVVWTPIPLGIVLIALGAVVILANSEAARAWVREQRAVHARFNAFLDRAEGVLPASLARILAETRPLGPEN